MSEIPTVEQPVAAYRRTHLAALIDAYRQQIAGLTAENERLAVRVEKVRGSYGAAAAAHSAALIAGDEMRERAERVEAQLAAAKEEASGLAHSLGKAQDAVRVQRAENERLTEQNEMLKGLNVFIRSERDALAAEVERLIASSKSALTDLQHVADERDKLAVDLERLTERIGTQTAEIERLNRDNDLLREAIDAWIADRDRLAAVITRVRERANWGVEAAQNVADLSAKADEPLKAAAARSARSVWQEVLDMTRDASPLALLDSPSTKETAECVNCGAPMPGRHPGDVCRDCQGSVPNTEEQRKKPRDCPGDGCQGCEGCRADPGGINEEQTNE